MARGYKDGLQDYDRNGRVLDGRKIEELSLEDTRLFQSRLPNCLQRGRDIQGCWNFQIQKTNMILNSDNNNECFDATSIQDQTLGQQIVVPNYSPPITYTQQDALGFEYQNQTGLEIDNQMIQETGLANWDVNQDLNFTQQPQMVNTFSTQNQSFVNSDSYFFTQTPCTQTNDMLNFSSISFTNPNQKFVFSGDVGNVSGSNILFPPMSHLNLPPQTPLFRELFHQSFPEAKSDGNGEFDNGVFEFGGEMNFSAKGREAKTTKHLGTELQRRVDWASKYTILKELIPSSTKGDRASIVADGINYIKELQRTVNELEVMVEKKRYYRDRLRRHKIEDESGLEVDGPSLRSSWLQRKSKNIEVDVRIIDDEVTIKLVQRKRINSLLVVSKVLDELQLDVQHVAGGLIGDFYSFLLNLKICEGSSTYASAIANKLIDVVDRQYAASQTSSSY
ncbi:Pentatricopeptide repeat-containing protein [Heracleum sosnowskyi]|uniref:Pentatricopeptide repeat-containing protein n=1 Tax=Heracleum sosnowskyi TaxID=360622 RepID=A0AAD8HBJ0_9APIA|nr:Pentatricopeptide repeat-containing protein [Heracleum sosnowskyi]